MELEGFCEAMERRMKGAFSTLMVLYTIGGSPEPVHGYGIIKHLEEVTGGCFVTNAGVVYPILRNLERKGLVSHNTEVSHRGPRRKVYVITDEGMEVLLGFDDVLGGFLESVERVREGLPRFGGRRVEG